jgi:periplasmic protein TonB
MTSNEILKADMLDILFDNRNKQYGAYALRKTYNNRLGAALGISLSTVMFLFFLIPKNKSSTIIDGDRGQVELRTIQIPNETKKIIPPPVKRIVQPVFRQKQFTSLIMVNKKTVDPPPDIRDLTTSIISNKTVDGQIPDNAAPAINQSVPVATEKQEKTVAKEMPVQREPEFPGGQQAWLNFLQKYLIAPEELEAGEKKMVAIRFSVSEEGVVTNFQVIQSAGASYDNEVIRVLKKMPKWKPAIQNGQPVARAFTQPVTFMGVEQ